MNNYEQVAIYVKDKLVGQGGYTSEQDKNNLIDMLTRIYRCQKSDIYLLR